MTLTLHMPENTVMKPQITVFGVGGAGGNATGNMVEKKLEGAEFVVANTDAQALANSTVERKVQLGQSLTQGLGAGALPETGKKATEEAINEIHDHLQGSNMVFITAGMGGGTGTGAAPVIAKAAREAGILTVAVVTKPFHFEGPRRMKIAEAGLEELQKYVDTLIIIPNQNLFRIANEKTTFADAFAMADDVLHSGVRGITDLMVMPGLINLDFADVRSVMSEMGRAMMGTGESDGENRAKMAAEAAISNPLLDNASMKGARGVLINITGGSDMTLFEVDEAANRVREEVDSDANIIFGSTFNEELEGKIRVSVVATGINSNASAATSAASNSSAVQSSGAARQGIAPAPNTQTSVNKAPVATPPAANISQNPAVQESFEEISIPEEAVAQKDAIDKEYYDAVQRLNQEYNSQKQQGRGFAAKQPITPENYNDQPISSREHYNTGTSSLDSDVQKESRSLFKKVAKMARSLHNPQESYSNPSDWNTSQKQQASQTEANQEEFAGTGNEEGLDIPAFLRRKNND